MNITNLAAITVVALMFYVGVRCCLGIGLVVDLTGKRDYLAMVHPLRALVLRWEKRAEFTSKDGVT